MGSEAWLSLGRFFLKGVAQIAADSTTMARDLSAHVNSDRKRVLASPSISVMAMRLFEQLPRHPIISVVKVTNVFSTSRPTRIKSIGALVTAEVLVETTGRKRDRLFRYSACLARLERDE